jgi:myo-inositol-1(or 4)-monophosphatase
MQWRKKMTRGSYQIEREVLVDAVRKAGKAVMRLASAGFETQLKEDGSPVTSADLEVNRILKDALSRRFPQDGWLSEEDPDQVARLEQKRVWVVDPIDGTKYFMTGVPQFTISAALVEDGRPVLGVVLNPATDELFSATRGAGAHLNGVPIRLRDLNGSRPTLLVSPPSFQRGRYAPLQPDAEIRPMGSIAYSLALIAAGQADGTLNLDRLSEWDIAAGVLLIEEAGGLVTDRKGGALGFNRPDPSVRGLLAGAPALHPLLQTLAERLARS